jgi:hypothetical protein
VFGCVCFELFYALGMGGRRRSPPDQGVYFIECAGFVKIGVGWSVRLRLMGLQTGSPLTLRPLGFILERDQDAAIAFERRLHERFAADRHRGEWFVLTDELRRFIAEIAQPWPWPAVSRAKRVFGAARLENEGPSMPTL